MANSMLRKGVASYEARAQIDDVVSMIYDFCMIRYGSQLTIPHLGVFLGSIEVIKAIITRIGTPSAGKRKFAIITTCMRLTV